jgi:peptide/nickel transport system substrate-binding protein
MPIDVAAKPSRFTGLRVAATLALGLVALPVVAMAQPKDEVVIAGAILRQQFDPSIMVAVTDHTAFTMLYDGLLNLNDKGKVPALATSWKISEDGKTVDFELRKGVKFHNGDPFTAEDVKFSYDLLLKDGNTHSYRKAFVAQIKSVEVVDPHKVRFNLNQPWPSFFSSARYGIQPIVPKNYYEKVGAKGFVEKPVGTGPFKLADMKAGEWTKFEANPDYWGQVSKVKFVTQKLVKEPFTLYAMLEKGEADVVFGLTGALLERVKSNKQVKIFESKYSGTSGIYFNTPKFPEAKDKRVRLAVAHAMNREAIAKNVLSGICQPASSIFTPGTFGHNPSLKPIPYDPAKAKALLAEAGIKPGKEITFSLHTESFGSLPSAPQVLEAIAGNLEAVGFKVVREPYDSAAYLAAWRAGKQPAVFYGPSSMPDDGGETLEGWFSSTAVWSSGYINEPEYDTVFKAQLGMTDMKKREKTLQDWAKLEDDKRTALPLFWCNTTYAVSPRVKAWAPAVISAYHYSFNTMELAK